jgi:peptide/nickel transport system substrate-binding protein
MDERQLRELIAQVKAGRMSRRGFIHTMVGLGLTAPLATQMLAYSGVAHAQPASTYKARAFSTSRSPPGTPTAT